MGIFNLFKKWKVHKEKTNSEASNLESSQYSDIPDGQFFNERNISGRRSTTGINGINGSVPEYNINRSNPIEEFEEKNLNIDRIEDRATFINGQCDRIKEASKQVEEIKIEFQLVSSYLADMQKIDMIPKEEREDLDDAARRIITLARDRSKYQNSNKKITDRQYRNIENYEDEMPSEIRKMKENEAFHALIKNDMRHLEGEKGALQYQKEEIIKKQKALKGIAMITCLLVVLLLILIFTLSRILQANVQIPFIMTIVLGAASSIFIFFESRRNTMNMKLVTIKQNKAIDLLNSVKIKMVNNTSVLDYSYNKFMVHNSKELEFLWEQYVKAKDEARRYEKNTELLDFYNETLIKELKKYDVSDPEIWIYQAIAIIDQKEMMEVRNRLNIRRQKLRERIDYNNQIRESCIQHIRGVIQKYPNLTREISEILEKNNINIIIGQ